MPKRIILLLDGTWNNWEAGDTDTNIVRLEDLIVANLERSSGTSAASIEAGTDRKVQSLKSDEGKDNYVLYQRGVGTGHSDKFTGGIFGEGLGTNIRRAYKFLSFHYEDGDQVFIFGFSRGAYTARSVVGYIAAAGLLKRDECSHENEEAAWSYYRTPPADRLPADWVTLTPFVHDRGKFRIECLGVFDTVGALGIPLELFKTKNRELHAFHDVTLSSITNVNLHAMAIDEQRKPFGATIWRRPKYRSFKTHTEQVWFPGVHADVGGGYVSAERRRQEATPSLDEISLHWMVKRLQHHFRGFPIDSCKPFDQGKWALAKQHNSRDLKYKIFRRALRTIANLPVTPLGLWQTVVSYDRRDEVIGEYIHVSALMRLGQKVPSGLLSTTYRPKNLISILPAIEASYRGTKRGSPVRVVDWNGEILATDAALHELKEAKRRLGLA